VANALSPAQVVKVEIDETNRIAAVTVPERMLSLAIGREGQNARLAAKLTGWRIDIRSDQAPARATEAPSAPATAADLEAGEPVSTSADEAPVVPVEEPAAAPKKRAPRKTAAAAGEQNGTAPEPVAKAVTKAVAKPRAKKAAPAAEAAPIVADAEPVAAAPARRSRKAATAVAEEGE
jgi:N utilization substance protein A